MKRSLRSHRDDRGVVALEFVLVVPCFLILIIGIVVMGNFLRVKTQTTGLARDGARAAALRQPLPTGTVVVGTACPNPTDTTKFVTVEADTDLTLRDIPFIPTALFLLPATVTEQVTMRCGG